MILVEFLLVVGAFCVALILLWGVISALLSLTDLLSCRRRARRFGYRIGPWKRKESLMPLTIESTNEEKIRITVDPRTSAGNPAPLDGPVRPSVVSGDSTIEAIDDRSFFVVSSDTPGDTTYLVEADADLGDGIVLIQDTIGYTVRGALATQLGLTAGTPEPK